MRMMPIQRVRQGPRTEKIASITDAFYGREMTRNPPGLLVIYSFKKSCRIYSS